MKPLYSVTYRYTPELILAFCRIHLWYHHRQHPLFLKTPGIFLVGCLIWRLFTLWHAGAGISLDDGITLILIGLFTFILLWMGFVHPYIFQRALQNNLDGPCGGKITLHFFPDHIQADSSLFQAEYPYTQISEAYLTFGCIYLYVLKNQALLIPFEGLREQDITAFQQFLEEKLPINFRVKTHLTL